MSLFLSHCAYSTEEVFKLADWCDSVNWLSRSHWNCYSVNVHLNACWKVPTSFSCTYCTPKASTFCNKFRFFSRFLKCEHQTTFSAALSPENIDLLYYSSLVLIQSKMFVIQISRLACHEFELSVRLPCLYLALDLRVGPTSAMH